MKNYRYYISILVLVLIGFVIYPLGILPFKGTFEKLISPFAKAASTFTLGTKNFFFNISQINKLTKINQDLANQILQLKADNTKCSEIAHQNEILQKELGFSEGSQGINTTPAAIISRSPSGFVQEFTINKGSKDGIQSGRPVLSDGYLIGTISEIYDTTSKVFLLTNYKSLVPVVLQNSRGTGLLKGGLEGLSIKDIAIDSQIQVGEKILTSGLGGDLPQGIVIGEVEKIISKESEIFQIVSVKYPINLNKLEVIFIQK